MASNSIDDSGGGDAVVVTIQNEEASSVQRAGMLVERGLVDFVTSVTSTGALIQDISIPGQQQSIAMPVLSKLGRRILHGVLSCVLSAHEAGLVLVYDDDDDDDDDDFRVYYYFHEGTTELVSVVYAGDAMLPPSPTDLLTRQHRDYQTLRRVIETLFPLRTMPLHVQSIHILLGKLARCIPAGPPEKRTQLLQAHAAMVSSPVGVATMCFNLKRLYDQLDRHRLFTFEQAKKAAAARTTPLPRAVNEQALFGTVYRDEKRNNANTTSTAEDQAPNYTGDTGMLNFARNWFTHVPQERWPPSVGGHEAQAQFTGLPQLDHIFTHHFSNFMPEALLQLYINFDDHGLLTEVLVPLA